MPEVSTVKLPTRTRDRLRARAQLENTTYPALIDAMLDGREEAEFWAALAAGPPPTGGELDDVDAAFDATATDGDLP